MTADDYRRATALILEALDGKQPEDEPEQAKFA